MKNYVSIICSLFIFLILIAYICAHMPSPVFGEVVFPFKVGKGVFRFTVKHPPVLLHLGVRVPKDEFLQDRVFNLTIVDEQVESIILKKQFNVSRLKKMSNTDMDKDAVYDYYSIMNLQNINIVKNQKYLIRIKEDNGGGERFGFIVFIRGLFH